jgi:Small metal-binding protein
MKKIILTSTTALLFSCLNVFAEPHLDEAITHATAAAQASGQEKLLEHARPALEHATAAALIARGVSLAHANDGVKALEDAIAKAKAKKTDEAQKLANSAVAHLKAANKK